MNMTRNSGLIAACIILAAGSIAIAQPAAKQPAKQASQPTAKQPAPAAPLSKEQAQAKMQECMMACMEAATPGSEHERLAKGVGTWNGKVIMYMPEMEPTKSDCVTTVTARMDGRFFECQTKGEMPGMGPFEGGGICGFDNVAKQYQTVWYDCMGTGMAMGTGELSSDGQTMTWTLTYNCPVKKGPVQMRQIEKITGPDTMTLEMHGPNPLTGEEFKMMEIAYTRDKAQAAVDTR